MGIFTSTTELVDLSFYMMRILAVGYIAMAVTQSLSGVMRGAGDTMTPMWISLFTTVVVRVPVAYGISWLTRTPGASQWAQRVRVYLPAPFLDAGSRYDGCLL